MPLCAFLRGGAMACGWQRCRGGWDVLYEMWLSPGDVTRAVLEKPM